MADPLSIAASVAGLITVAGQISKAVSGFIASVAEAPESAMDALSAVEEMHTALQAIQRVMDTLATKPKRRKEMISASHLMITFRESVRSLSELEAALSGLGPGADKPWDRVKWMLQEDKIVRCLDKLQAHKISLSMMLSILQCESDFEAEASLHVLQETVQMVVEQNEELLTRLQQFEYRCLVTDETSVRFFDDESSRFSLAESVPTTTRRWYPLNPRPGYTSMLPRVDESFSAPEPDYYPGGSSQHEFERTLEGTRVYQRVQFNDASDISFTSSAVGTHAWSMLSGLSLNDISVISVIALPLTLSEIISIGPDVTFAKIMFGAQEAQPDRDIMEKPLPTPPSRTQSGYISSLFPPPTFTPSLHRVFGTSGADSKGQSWRPRIPFRKRLSLVVREKAPRPRRRSISNDSSPKSQSSFEETASSTSHASRASSRTSLGPEVYRLVMLGEGGVGKTALILASGLFGTCHWYETFDPTIEDNYDISTTIDKRQCMVKLTDTSGLLEYLGLRGHWIERGDAFILVYSIASRMSFERVREIHRHIVQQRGTPGSRFDYPPPVMLVGSQCDRHTERQVSTDEGHALAKALGCEFVEASSKTFFNTERAFHDAVRALRRQAGEDAPRDTGPAAEEPPEPKTKIDNIAEVGVAR